MVMTIVLIAIIAACAVFIWGQIFGGNGGGGERNTNLGYQCQVCDHQFIITDVQLREQVFDGSALEKDRTRSMDQAHCPKCGEKHTGLAMHQCPECSHYFLPSKVNVRTNPDAVIPPAICPKCNTNYDEWMLKH